MSQSVFHSYKQTVEKRGSRVAAQYKAEGTWRDVTWNEIDEVQQKASAALAKLGIKPKERVAIIANTRLEWAMADLAILGAGCVTIPVYQSNLPREVTYILDDSNSVAVFAEDDSQLEKIRGEKKDGNLKDIRVVIAITGSVEGDEISWDDFLAMGEEHLKENAEEVAALGLGLTKDDVLTYIYTSGTTGNPKGAILTHDCMLYEAEAIEEIGVLSPDELQYLFLPLAHVFAKVLEVAWISTGHTLAFWEGDQKKIVENLAEVRPTMMAAVPRIYEKIHAAIATKVENGEGIKGKLGRWALAKGDEMARREQAGGTAGGLGWALAQKLVYSKISGELKAKFGGRLRYFISGGAPLGRDIAYFYKYTDITICEGYGLTETSAASTILLPDDIRIGTVGRALPGTELKIANDGEILIRGRGVMKGYHGREDATKECINDDGWFLTGDIGEIDKDGFLRITDRKKDIIVTAGGKNVAPQNIENTLKAKSPLIGQVVVHGDKRKYLSALVVVDPDAVQAWASTNGLSGDYESLSQKPELKKEIDGIVDTLNSSLAKYETLKKIYILNHDFEIGNQLTPTLKVKRKACNEQYKEIFDGFYE
ncbi:MAG: long-chain fatty acid--CoA ligase [Deltaproteobacteria bacterium]|nr:long-chain fatty acid--CoA ligase [Deltaproteobacteria bacterium]